MAKVKVALIGYGHLGKWHAQKALDLENSELIAIVDPSEKSQALAKETYPDVPVVGQLSEVIDQIDAGLVVTPTSFHAKVCEQLLENNKHVFCEKPVTSTLKEAMILKEMAAGKNIVFQVGHSERCHQFWQRISEFKDIIDGSTIVNIVRNSPFKGRAADVGVVEDLMIHDIDLMRMFFGSPMSVKAYGAKVITDKWDHAMASFYYDQRVVHIENSRNDIKVQRSVQFNSPRGILHVDLLNLKVLWSKNIKSDEEQVINEESYERKDHLLIEQEYFYNSILNNSDVFVTLEDGIEAVSIIEKVNMSLKTNELVGI
jgi:predicted dehydrogenase